MLQTKQLCVCFFACNIFSQLKSCLLQQPLQSLAVSMGQSQNELSSVLAAPAAEERHQFPLQIRTFPCNVPLGSATSLQLRCDAARGKSRVPQPGWLGMLTGSCGLPHCGKICSVSVLHCVLEPRFVRTQKEGGSHCVQRSESLCDVLCYFKRCFLSK